MTVGRRRWGIGIALVVVAPAVAVAATITGTVIGDGAHPIDGARVEVVRRGDEAPCATTTGADGTFALSCGAEGVQTLRASRDGLEPWTVEATLAADAALHLNFMLRPPQGSGAAGSTPAERDVSSARVIPNPVVVRWGERMFSLRMVAAATAAITFVVGGFVMLAIGRRFGVATRTLSSEEVADLVTNPLMPSVGERRHPVAAVGARGAAAEVSFGADEIVAALAAGPYGLVALALVVVPTLLATSSLAFAVAMLVGQETYLLYAALLVPLGFVGTALVIGAQAFTRHWHRPPAQ